MNGHSQQAIDATAPTWAELMAKGAELFAVDMDDDGIEEAYSVVLARREREHWAMIEAQEEEEDADFYEFTVVY